jgi:hypothetical protein
LLRKKFCKMNIRQIYFLFLLPALFPVLVFAADATMEIAPSVGTHKVYDDVTLYVLISSDNQDVSAVEGHLSYNPKELTVTHVSKNNSPISSWTQEPLVNAELGEIVFGGALATATKMKSTTVLTFRVRPERSGETRIRFDGGAAIISADGLGSNILTSFKSGKYRILPEDLSDEPALGGTPTPTPVIASSASNNAQSGEVLGFATQTPPLVVDRTPPADFILTEVPGRSLDDIDIVVNVSAVDEGAGIDYYTFAIDDGAPVRWEDRGTHHFVYQATTTGAHTLTGVVYDRAGNASIAKLISEVGLSSGVAAAGFEEEANFALTAKNGGMLSRHPFLPVAIVLLLLIVFFAVRIMKEVVAPIEAIDVSSDEEQISRGQIVLTPPQRKKIEQQ